MKSVCHLTSVHPTFDIRIFHKECVSLARNGFSVTLITSEGIENMVDSVQIRSIQLPKNRFGRMLFVTHRMLRKALKQNASLYHFHDPELMLCGVFLKLSGKKVIFDIHENVGLSIVSKKWLPRVLRPVIKLIYRLFEKVSILFYDALVLAEDSYLKYYPKAKSVVVLNYPIIDEELPNIVRQFEQPYKFIYTGGISEERGLWEMVQLIQMLNENGFPSKLTLIGQIWSAKLKESLMDYLVKHDLEQHIEWHGKIPFSKVKYYLEESDFGLALLHPIPNYLESLPTKIFEYMQYGLPFIISDFSLYKKYINESSTGLGLNVQSLDQESEKIGDWLLNKQLLKEMAANGQKAVKEKYNWTTQESKLLSLYHKIDS